MLFFYFLICLLLYYYQTRLIFVPSKNVLTTPKEHGIDYNEQYILSKNGNKVYFWEILTQNPKYTVVFFHGNAGNVSSRIETIYHFKELDIHAFMLDYQGYGLSEGTPTEKNIYSDSIQLIKTIIEQKNINPDNMIYWGRSLGGAVAAELALHYPPKALILESTFTSIVDMAKLSYPYIPVSLIVQNKFDTLKKIDQITVPKLFIHSPQDDIVPYQMSKLLFEKSLEPKHFLTIKGDHNSGFFTSQNIYIKGIEDFLKTLNP